METVFKLDALVDIVGRLGCVGFARTRWRGCIGVCWDLWSRRWRLLGVCWRHVGVWCLRKSRGCWVWNEGCGFRWFEQVLCVLAVVGEREVGWDGRHTCRGWPPLQSQSQSHVSLLQQSSSIFGGLRLSGMSQRVRSDLNLMKAQSKSLGIKSNSLNTAQQSKKFMGYVKMFSSKFPAPVLGEHLRFSIFREATCETPWKHIWDLTDPWIFQRSAVQRFPNFYHIPHYA